MAEPQKPWQPAPDTPFEVIDGDTPVLLHVPHAGLHIPADVREGIVLDDEALAAEQLAMTDHRTDVLAADAIAGGAAAFVNRLSRLVIDPERFLDPTQEHMESVGMGAVYTATSTGATLRTPTPDEREQLLDRWFRPYAAALEQHTVRTLERHGRMTLLDVHSFPSRRLPYEIGDDARPQVCIGIDDVHTPPWLSDLVQQEAQANGWEVATNSPFAGTYVPLGLLGDDRVTSVMLELRRDLHIDEDTAHPSVAEDEVVAFVGRVAARAAAMR